MESLFDVGSLSLLKNSLAWKIPDFFSLPLTLGREIRSPEFMFTRSRCVLMVWPRGMKGFEDEEWFGICLYKYDSKKRTGPIQFSIVKNGKPIKSCKVECSENGLYRNDKFVEWSEFQLLKSVIAPTGSLTIECRMFCESTNQGENAQNTLLTSEFELLPSLQNSKKKFPSVDNIWSAPTAAPSMLGSGITPVKSQTDLSLLSKSKILTSINSFLSLSASIEAAAKNVPQTPATNTTPGTNSEKQASDGFEFLPPMQNSRNKFQSVDHIWPVPPNIPLSTDSGTTSAESLTPDNSGYKSDDPSSTSSSISSCSSIAPASDKLPKPAESVNTVATITNDEKQLTGLKKLSQNLKKLYIDGEDSDLTIKARGREFHVHKLILKARSSAFASLFSQSENINHVICIDDFDPGAFHEFLLYVYSGEIENLTTENVCDMYCLAQKYAQMDLKEICIDFMKMSLSFDTICDVISLALKMEEDELLQVATFFFARNLKDILVTDKWHSFMKENTRQANELYIKALEIGYTKRTD